MKIVSFPHWVYINGIKNDALRNLIIDVCNIDFDLLTGDISHQTEFDIKDLKKYQAIVLVENSLLTKIPVANLYLSINIKYLQLFKYVRDELSNPYTGLATYGGLYNINQYIGKQFIIELKDNLTSLNTEVKEAYFKHMIIPTDFIPFDIDPNVIVCLELNYRACELLNG